MPIRLLALDIDDTLYEWPGEVSPANRAALSAAQTAGIVVCIATARIVSSADNFLSGLDLHGPLIANSGATVRMQPAGEVVTRAAMPRRAALPIVEFADERGVVLWVTLSNGTTYVRDDTEQTPEALARRIFPVAANIEGLLGDPVRIIAMGEGGEAICRELGEQLSADFSLCRTIQAGVFKGVTITAREATKEAALAEVCAALGISMQDVLAMGDAEADLGMIRAAGIGIAPANADPTVLAAADVVAPSCAEDAVAWAIERYCSLESTISLN